MTVENRDTRGIWQEVTETAERLRGHIGFGPHWPLILTVPTALNTNATTALALAGITVEVDRYCPPDHWYLRDGVKR